MTNAAKIHCIYCGNWRSPSDEHIVQRSLGGNLRPPLACGPCNSSLSRIDQALAERSLISLPRIARTAEAKRVYLGGTHFYHDTEADLWLEVEVSNGFRTTFLPQIHRRDRDFYLRASSREDVARLIEAISEKVADGSLLNTYVTEDSGNHGATTSIVNYRRHDLRVRANTREQGVEILRWINEEWPNIADKLKGLSLGESEIPMPLIHFTQSIRLDDMYRGVAKIAYGYLAFCEGAEFALRDEFTPIREYIAGKSIVHPEELPEGAIAVDTRFVQRLPRGTTIGVPTEDHSVMIFYHPPLMLGFVTLYKDSGFIVTLGSTRLDRQVIKGHEFSSDGTKNADLDIMEIGRRIWQLRQAEAARESSGPESTTTGDAEDTETDE
jgi:hypothetical protein